MATEEIISRISSSEDLPGAENLPASEDLIGQLSPSVGSHRQLEIEDGMATKLMKNLVVCDDDNVCRVIGRSDLPRHDYGEDVIYESGEEENNDVCAHCQIEDPQKRFIYNVIESFQADFAREASIENNSIEKLRFIFSVKLTAEKVKLDLMNIDPAPLEQILDILLN